MIHIKNVGFRPAEGRALQRADLQPEAALHIQSRQQFCQTVHCPALRVAVS